MKKKILLLAACLGMTVLSMTGCRHAGTVPQEVTNIEPERNARKEQQELKEEEIQVWIENPLPEEAEEAAASEKWPNSGEFDLWINDIEKIAPLNLTKAQKAQDYDVLWDMFQEKVYCLDEIAAGKGINLKEHIADWREMVINTRNDLEFYKMLQKSVEVFDGAWNMRINMPYNALLAAALESDQDGEAKYLSEENIKKLRYWDAVLKKNDWEYRGYRNLAETERPLPELETLNDKVALITIPTLRYGADDQRAADRMIELMQKVSEYEHVIFDVKAKEGGSFTYVYNNIIAPNIDENAEFQSLQFYKQAEDVERWTNREMSSARTVRNGYVSYTEHPDRPLNELPKEMEVSGGAFGNADYYSRTDMVIQPRFDKKILQGKIWVLTYPENVYAAEGLAAFCKETGFATLVGKQTGGKGLDQSMCEYVLPNSGLTAVSGFAWGLNPDGTNNFNEGTKPDIESPEEETPLETCLKEIIRENKE